MTVSFSRPTQQANPAKAHTQSKARSKLKIASGFWLLSFQINEIERPAKS
jgi:hypothetical protein